MSGHSHWSGIKHKKAVADAKRAQIFTKLGHAIAVAARSGGSNPDFNPALRLAIDKAKEFNMPKDRIKNSIKKGTREGLENKLVEAQYEAMGPFGTMLIIKVITDNKNRAVSDLRRVLEKHGGKMADGGVSWNFKREGTGYVPQYAITLDSTQQEKYQKLLADLADQPDVQEFYDNLE